MLRLLLRFIGMGHFSDPWVPIHMGLLPDTKHCGLHMRRECREHFLCHRFERKPLVSDPGMHHGTCVAHVTWCMSGSLTRGSGENVPSIPGACATSNFTYLARGPLAECLLNVFLIILGTTWDNMCASMTCSLAPCLDAAPRHHIHRMPDTS